MVRDSTILFATAGILLAAVGITGAIASEQMRAGDAYVFFLGAVIIGFVVYLLAAISVRGNGD